MYEKIRRLDHWLKRYARNVLQRERRKDPIRLEALSVQRLRAAEFFESSAAAVVIGGLGLPFLRDFTAESWLMMAIMVAIIGPALLAEGCLSRAIARQWHRSAQAEQHARIDATRRSFAAMPVRLTRERLLTMRQRGVGNDVRSALHTFAQRSQGAFPILTSGAAVLLELDILLGRERTDEVLPDVERAITT